MTFLTIYDIIENERGLTMAVHQATASEVLSILRSHHKDVLSKQIPTTVHLSPHGNRVHVSVYRGEVNKVPPKGELKYNGSFVIVPFEAEEDILEFKSIDDS